MLFIQDEKQRRRSETGARHHRAWIELVVQLGSYGSVISSLQVWLGALINDSRAVVIL